MPDYLLNDLMKGVLFLVVWSIVVIWIMFVGYRYIRYLHNMIDSLREENATLKHERRMCWPSLSEEIDNLRAANDILKADLEQCYARLPTEEWRDVLTFGDSDPRREVVN